MKTIARLILSLLVCTSLSFCTANSKANAPVAADSFTIRTDWQTHFTNCRVEGSVVIFDRQNKQWIVSDTTGIKTAVLPASSFKVANLLIALESGVIKDENEVVKWPGATDTVKYGYRPEIYHDMTVREAFAESAGWVFVELAKKIGKEKYQQHLKAYHYGNGVLTQTDADFWNFGAFGISPLNQVQFLQALYEGQLPASQRNMDIVKRVMKVEQDKGYTISAKTGWTRDNGINTGWWIGYVESDKGVHFFATRLLQDRRDKQDNFGACRKEITRTVLKDLGVLPK